MNPTVRRLLVGCLCSLVFAPARAAAPPAGGVRADRDRHALPEGAFARLGSMRFRVSPSASVHLSPDGRTIAALDERSGLRFLDARSGEELRRIALPAEASAGVFCPVTNAFAVLEKQSVRFYSPQSSRPVRTIEVGEIVGTSLAFSGDGKVVAVAGWQGQGQVTVGIFDAKGKRLRSLKPLHDSLVHVALSASGRIIVGWSGEFRGNKAQVWDVIAGTEIARYDGGARLSCAALSPDGKLLALTTTDGALQLWAVTRGKRLWAYQAQSGPHRLRFSRDGSTLLVGGSLGVLSWDVARGKRLRLFPGPTAELCSIELAPDGSALACGRGGAALAVWNVMSGKPCFPAQAHRSHVEALAYSVDGKQIVSLDGSQKGLVWEGTGKPCWGAGKGLPAVLGPGLSAVRPIFLSPRGKHLIANSWEGHGLQLWDLATGKVAFSLPRANAIPTFSQGGRLLAVGAWGDENRGDQVYVLRARTGEVVASFAIKGQVMALAFTPDTKRVVMATAKLDEREKSTTLSLWDVAAGKTIVAFRPASLPGALGYPECFRCSPQGDLLAIAEPDNCVRLRSLRTGAVLRSIPVGEHVLFRLAFTRDGRSLAVVVFDQARSRQKLVLWEVRTGKKRWELPDTDSDFTALAFSPDGQVLATGHADGSILLWDVTGRRLARPERGGALGAKEAERLWADLDSTDAARAYRASRALVATPVQTLALFRKLLRLIAPSATPPATIARWVRELDSDDFGTRDKARIALEKEGGSAEAALRKALATKPPLEQVRHIERLLARLSPEHTPPDMLRPARAIEVMEWIGTKEARRFLAELAKGQPDIAQTREAKGALRRLALRAAR